MKIKHVEQIVMLNGIKKNSADNPVLKISIARET